MAWVYDARVQLEGAIVRHRLVVAMLLIAFRPAVYIAQSSTAEQEIRTLDDQRIAAILKKDVAMLDRLMTDDFTYTHQGGVTESKADYLKEMASGNGVFTSLKMSGVTIRMLGETAVMTGRCDMTAVREGRNLAIPMHFTSIYTRMGGRWRWVLWHSTRLPAEHPPA